jgi:hypothetical protein
MSTLALLLLFANSPADQTTLPRHPDPDPVEQQASREGTPTDPWFDRAHVATDDPAFVLAAVESARQAVADARAAQQMLVQPELRAAAGKIGAQNDATRKKLEAIAGRKGWRVPADNPQRATTLQAGKPTRTAANFIVSQISYHQSTLDQFRAQIGGQGDAELRRALRDALPGYRDNLEMLLALKP